MPNRGPVGRRYFFVLILAEGERRFLFPVMGKNHFSPFVSCLFYTFNYTCNWLILFRNYRKKDSATRNSSLPLFHRRYTWPCCDPGAGTA